VCPSSLPTGAQRSRLPRGRPEGPGLGDLPAEPAARPAVTRAGGDRTALLAPDVCQR